MAAQSTLLYAAVATNVVLGVALFYVITRDRRSKAFRSPRPRPTGPLTPYLDRDYVPPLPQLRPLA